MFSMTEINILKLFCSNLAKSYSIRQIAKNTGQPFPITFKFAKQLIDRKILAKDEHNFIFLNKKNFQSLSYIESIRETDFSRKHKEIRIFADEAEKKIDISFVLLVFGSYAENKQTAKSDVDILMIIDNGKEAEKYEKLLFNIAELYIKSPHIMVVGRESAKEMLNSKKMNVLKETFKAHIIFFGAENYYRMIEYA